MGQLEYLRKREEYVAKAALMGLTYDWYDHTFNRPYENNFGAALYDPDTGELLADANKDTAHYNSVVSERAKKYGNSILQAQPDHGQEGEGTSGGND